MVNHDVPHHLRGRRDKVGPALPDRRGVIDQPEVGSVEDGGGLQRVAGPLPAHVMVGEAVRFGDAPAGSNFPSASSSPPLHSPSS